MKSNGLVIYLERLRSARHLSQMAFVEDIVSLRQYRRYLNGESDIPFNMIQQLSQRLNLQIESILREFEAAKLEETKMMNKLYNFAVNYDFDGFNQLKKQISEEHIIDQSNLMLYKHSLTIHDYYAKKINVPHVKRMNIDLVDYPNVLDQGVLNTTELLILTFLIDVMEVDEQKLIINKLLAFLEHKQMIISGGNDRVLTLILARLAKHSGILKNYDQVNQFCDIGIKNNKAQFSYYLMDYFYYYKSLAYFKLERIPEFQMCLNKLFNLLEFEGNENKKLKFMKLINEDYAIDFKDYVLDLYKQTEKS